MFVCMLADACIWVCLLVCVLRCDGLSVTLCVFSDVCLPVCVLRHVYLDVFICWCSLVYARM